ncbi:MAG TPA: hypothetical protein VM409_03165 [Chloroflexia bacterium]|nr:hypothetical protein [Chloroflexia bacterium]
MDGVGRVLGHGGVRVGSAEDKVAQTTEEVDERPKSVYELMTRRMLEEMREDISEVKARVNALLWLMAGAILMEFVMRVVR